MFAAAAVFASLYDTGPYGLASSCLLGAVPFAGILSDVDVQLDTVATGTHLLHYQHGSITLAAGDLVLIGASSYKVIGVPLRTEDDVTANLVLQ